MFTEDIQIYRNVSVLTLTIAWFLFPILLLMTANLSLILALRGWSIGWYSL